MKTSKNLKLKKGDIVYYISQYGDKLSLIANGYDGDSIKEFERVGSVITKVERPIQYKTIYEAPEPILDQKEKEYLETLIRPFKDDVLTIAKVGNLRFSFIQISYKDFEDGSTLNLHLPRFQGNSMYKGMEPDREYTINELGLFEGE